MSGDVCLLGLLASPMLLLFICTSPQKRGAWGIGAELICSVVAGAVLVQFQVQDQTGLLASNQLKLVHLEKTEVEEIKTTVGAKAFPGYLPVSLSHAND